MQITTSSLEKLLVQLTTELTLISLHSLVALPSLGGRVGFGVGAPVPLLQLVGLALVSLVPLVSIVRCLCRLLVLCFPPLLGFLLQRPSMLLILNSPTGSSVSQGV